jgi:peroxiredoxin Q/BCP
MRLLITRLLGTAALVALAGLALTAGDARADKEPAAKASAGKVEEGKEAPNFTLPAANAGDLVSGKKGAKMLTLKDLRGKTVVLFFFPKAMTPGCTAQCKGFTSLRKEYAKLNAVPLGISTDTLAAQEKFTEHDSLGIPLLADARKEVARTYGVLSRLGFANRTTFVIDKKGVVRKIYRGVNARKNPREVLDYVKEHLASK